MANEYALATSSYRGFRASMGTPVRISLGIPKFEVPQFNQNRRITALTPGGDYFRASSAEFDRRFYGQLEEHGVAGITAAFERIAERHPGTLVLLCFETVPLFNGSAIEQVSQEANVCHRRMFASWWLARTGELIPELRAANVQPTLW